jgi:drug/metabolite transporter (DMT)-like permease
MVARIKNKGVSQGALQGASQGASHHTPWWALLLVALCTLLVAATHYLFKLAILRSGSSVVGLAFDPYLLFAIFLSVLGGGLLTYALKHGELSVLYPFISLGFIWVAIEGVLFFGEHLSAVKIAGIGVIMVGVSLIGHTGMRKRSSGGNRRRAEHEAKRKPARRGR